MIAMVMVEPKLGQGELFFSEIKRKIYRKLFLKNQFTTKAETFIFVYCRFKFVTLMIIEE